MLPEVETGMTASLDTPILIAVIEGAMQLTRENAEEGEPIPSDDYYAWVILQELRRAGWKIVRNPG
jgi:hypothetical protein